MPPTWTIDAAIAPEAALRRIATAINLPKKRAFGVLKLESEYVGFIRGDDFEIWERQRRAIHGLGSVRGRRGGSRIALRIVLPRRTKALIGIFFALYAVVAAGLVAQPPRTTVGVLDVAVALAGAAVLAAIFAASAAQQRADLRRFVERVFGDVPRI